jgi:RHS repeat-associated protein
MSVTTPFRFGGQFGYYRDVSTRSYVRARYLDPTKGRWISQDPLGHVSDNSNLYRYAKNRPVGLIDPSGLITGEGKYSSCCIENDSPMLEATFRPVIFKEAKATIKDDVGEANDVFAQCCIRFRDLGRKNYNKTQSVRRLGDDLLLYVKELKNNRYDFTDEEYGMSDEQDDQNQIFVYYVKGFVYRVPILGHAYSLLWGDDKPPVSSLAMGNNHDGGNTLAHELGHVLGLIHEENDKNNLMHPLYSGTKLTETQCNTVRTFHPGFFTSNKKSPPT